MRAQHDDGAMRMRHDSRRDTAGKEPAQARAAVSRHHRSAVIADEIDDGAFGMLGVENVVLEIEVPILANATRQGADISGLVPSSNVR